MRHTILELTKRLEMQGGWQPVARNDHVVVCSRASFVVALSGAPEHEGDDNGFADLPVPHSYIVAVLTSLPEGSRRSSHRFSSFQQGPAHRRSRRRRRERQLRR